MASPYGMFSLGTNISERPRNYKYKDDDEDTSGPYVPLLERVAPRLYQSTREDINWVNNPPKGHTVVTGRGRDENAAIESAIAGTDSPLDTHIEKEGNEFVAYALIEDSVLGGRPEEAMLDTYEQPGLELEEEEEEEGIAWGAIGPEAENRIYRDRGRLKRRSLSPELQLEEQKRQDEASATPGLDPNLPDEFYPSAALRGKYLEEDEDRALEDKLLQLSSEPSVTDSGFDLPAKTAPGLNITPYISEEELAKMPRSERIQYRKSRLRSVGAGENLPPDTPTGKTNEELREQMRVQDQRVAQARTTDRVAGGDPRLAGKVDLPDFPMGEDEDGSGLLQMLSGLGGGIAGLGGDIGRWAKDNPELVMAGLQTIGELGGQYKRSRREQEASDAEDQERRMSTAISALTRGRVTPEVGRRVPRTTTGEGIFDVMAGIGRGGQQFLEAKRGRDEREEAMEMYRADRTRTQRIEDTERDRRAKREDDETQQEIEQFNKKLALEQYKAETGRIKTEGELLGNIDIGDLAPDESGNLSQEQMRQIDAVLTRLEEHNENPVFGTTLGQTGMGPGVGDVASRAIWEVAPTGGQRAAVLNPQYFDRLTTEIVFRVLKPLSEEGRLTKDDFENLRNMAGQAGDDIRLRRRLTKNIREALETKLRPVGTHPTWGLGGGKEVGGQVQVEEQVGADNDPQIEEQVGADNDPQNIELTEAQEALIFLAHDGDEEALEELRRMGILGN